MKTFVLGTLAAALLTGTVQFAAAQETIEVGGVAATRVVIAPPKSPLAQTIKSGLADSYYALSRGTRAYDEAQKLYFYYGARYFEPIWLTESGSGEIVFSDQAEKIIEAFKSAHLAGLRVSDYLNGDIALAADGVTPADLARLETAFSSAAIRYATDLHSGRISPRDVSSSITERPHRLDETQLLIDISQAEDPAAFFASLEPKHREYQALKATLAEIEAGTFEQQVPVPEGKMLKLGMTDERVPVLRERLGVEPPKAEDGSADTGNIEYDATLVAAVENFQESLGLLVDGVAGPATIAALNGGGATSREDIVANMEMWRWLPTDLGEFRVFVNIPEFKLDIMRGETSVHTTRVVVGKPIHKTPVFSDEIEHIVVNPYWNVPSSIASNEIAPLLAANPDYIANHNMELLHGGQVVNAAAFDWSATNINNFRIRQRPGAGNALGSVKFLFPNQHDVYLHDTPSKSLFQRSYRAFSHGCVRVMNPWEFAQALLAEEPEITLASLESQRGATERWNNLKRHVPVHLAYFTLRADLDGTIRSYGDVYGHMGKLKELLAR